MSATSTTAPCGFLVSSLASFLLLGIMVQKSSMRCRYLLVTPRLLRMSVFSFWLMPVKSTFTRGLSLFSGTSSSESSPAESSSSSSSSSASSAAFLFLEALFCFGAGSSSYSSSLSLSLSSWRSPRALASASSRLRAAFFLFFMRPRRCALRKCNPPPPPGALFCRAFSFNSFGFLTGRL